MPRLKCKLNSLKVHKYSSLWFALKATQNTHVFRNEANQQLVDNNDDCIEMNNSNCGYRGCVDENQLIGQNSYSDDSSVDSRSRNSVNHVMTDQRLKAIDVIEIDGKRALVLINKKESNYELTFGCLRMTSMTGNFHISLNGFTLLPNKSVELMAIFGYKILIKCRANQTNDNQDINDVKLKLQSLPIESKQIELILSQIEANNSCVLLIEKLCLSSLLYLENIPNFKPLSIKSESVWFELQNTGSHCFLKTEIWDTLFTELNLTQNDIIVVCGGKDVGKSSLIRHLVNKYLSEDSSNSDENQIFYLDCDPGQTEFSNSGQLSLTVIDKPILTSNSMNVINFKPLISSSIGVITANKNPRLYISIIYYIMNYISDNLESKGPLFINTMGWTRDLGLALLIDIIKMAFPTHIIQIDSVIDHKKNFTVDLTPKFVMKNQGFRFGPMDGNETLDYKLTVIESHIAAGHTTQAKTNRMLTQLSYISQMPEVIFKPIFAITPFKINWSQVYLHIASDSPTSHELVLDILNCSWVQLCKIEDNSLNYNEYDGIRIIDSILENRCFGCGIIRGLDIEQKCFYLISPESLEIINSINCIVRPLGVPIPESIVLDQLKYSYTSNLPYVYHSHNSIQN